MIYKDLRVNWNSNLYARISNKRGKVLFDNISTHSKDYGACIYKTHTYDGYEVDYFSPMYDYVFNKVCLDIVLIANNEED